MPRIQKLILLLPAILLVNALLGCATENRAKDREKADLYLQMGTSYLVHGDYPLALKALLDSERLNPSNPATENNLGLAYYVREKMDDAEKHFKKALSLKPNFTEARNNLGRLYMDVGLYQRAIHELKIAAADLTYNEPAKSWSNLGQAYFLAGEYSLAKDAFLNSLRSRKGSCATMDYYGRTLYMLKQYAVAAESLDRAIDVCGRSKFDEPHFYSGMSFYKLGNIEKARARFSELVSMFPDSQYAKQANQMLEILK